MNWIITLKKKNVYPEYTLWIKGYIKSFNVNVKISLYDIIYNWYNVNFFKKN